TRIAFVSFEVGQGNLDIWAMNAESTAPVRLPQEAGPDLSPDWQPLPVGTINGSDQGDDLTGTDGNDVICAGDGNDHVGAGDGDDLVFGGGGSDVLEGRGGGGGLLGDA